MSVLIKLYTDKFLKKEQRLTCMIAGSLVMMIISNVILDYWVTQFNNSAFYIIEALIFSSYWVLYLPLLFLLLKLMKRTMKNIGLKLALTGSAIIIHLFTYPAFVWALSKVFYYHTFDYWQTFNFGLSAYFIKSTLIYGFSFLAFNLQNYRTKSSQITGEVQEETKPKSFINSILISDNNNVKSVLDVNGIFYISANSPYVNIYHVSKAHLHNETLKSLEKQLNQQQFIRIHKSYIVNLQKITCYQSRQNGDYDVVLSDGAILRVSRNYAKHFKSKFEQYTHLTAK